MKQNRAYQERQSTTNPSKVLADHPERFLFVFIKKPAKVQKLLSKVFFFF